MFKKILVVEDYDSINVGIVTALSSVDREIYNTKYCDDAWVKIKGAEINNSPFDLIITDLSFVEDYRETTIKGGADLIRLIKRNYPKIKIIVYSIENRYIEINTLLDELKVDAYVSKGRDSLKDIISAIDHISKSNTPYLSIDIKELKSNPTALILTDEDLEIIQLLSEGFTQNEISIKFKEKNSHITSTSSIEKRISKIKTSFDAKNTIHLVSIAKDMGLI